MGFAEPNRPRIIAMAMVKNEQDIIEPFVRHNLQFVDYLVVLDNDSTDATRGILLQLMREFSQLVVTDSTRQAYDQSERMTKLLQVCQSAFFADFAIVLDADEFISAPTREAFETTLSRVPQGGIGVMLWQNFLLTPQHIMSETVDPPRTMTRTPISAPGYGENPPQEKIVLRLDRAYAHDVIIWQGNHGAGSSVGRVMQRVELPELHVLHFPIRGLNQFVAKHILGWLAYVARNPDARSLTEGYHWRENFDIAVSGGVTTDMLCEASQRYVIRDCQPDLGAPTAQPLVQWNYSRKYFQGAYADPLSLVATGWERALATRPSPLKLQRNPAFAAAAASAGDTAFDADWHWNHQYADIPPFRYLSERHSPDSVLDVGCGVGAYLQLFKNFGATMIFGVDGIDAAATVLGPQEYQARDLTQPMDLGRSFDLVICTEVAEHLPAPLDSVLLDNIARHATTRILFSAAEPSQPGIDHINCRPITDWLRAWRERGWVPDLDGTLALRCLSTLVWFRRNLVLLVPAASATGPDGTGFLEEVGRRPYGWYHLPAGIYEEVLSGNLPGPPDGYAIET